MKKIVIKDSDGKFGAIWMRENESGGIEMAVSTTESDPNLESVPPLDLKWIKIA